MEQIDRITIATREHPRKIPILQKFPGFNELATPPKPVKRTWKTANNKLKKLRGGPKDVRSNFSY